MPVISTIAAATARAFGAFKSLGGAADEFFNYVTLLLHGDGTNGAQNNTFLDSSTNNFTITRNGNTTQGTFSPFSQTGWSNYFDGSGDYCTFSSNSAMDFGTGAFTIEAWIYTGDKTVSVGASRTIIGNSGNSYTMQLYIDSSVGKVVFGNTGSTNLQGTSNVANNAWNHVVVVRSGTGTNQTAIFVNGSREAVGTNTQNYTSGTIYLGAFDTGNGFWNGYISNLRIVKGTAVYDPTQTTLTVPTTPLTAITNTSLLTCQSNRFRDASTNNFAITVAGNTSVQAFSPFAPTAAYSAATVGGSGYFDGSGDYLATPTSSQPTAAGDFTVSCWFYLTSFASSYYVLGGNWSAETSDEWLIQIQNNGAIRFLTSADGTFSSTGVVRLNEWMYFSATRSGSTVTVQVNGTTVRTYTKSDTLGSASKSINIGQQPGNSWPFNGYITDFRFVSGSAITAIPTAPATAISGTSLLLNFTNGGIIDNTAKNVLETVGNAQISTSIVKYGTGSMYFDGNGDNLSGPTSPNLNMGTGNWTIECWVYISSRTLNYPLIFGNNNGGYSAGALALTNSNADSASYNDKFVLAAYDVASPTLVASSTNSLNTWYHLALVRNGTSLVMYRDGTSVASTTISSSVVFDWGKLGFKVGGGNWDGAQSYFNGYIDDMRITKGVARYTANFTPPIARMPNQ